MGAPFGLVLVRTGVAGELRLASLVREVRRDLPTFLYVTVSTLVVFSAFGYVLGRQADALMELSRTDPLTGLRNQRAFEERLAEELARSSRYSEPLSLLVVDVDRLKAVNDRHGHRAGDLALQTVAGALKQDARQTDLTARVGGDEFALIAPSTDRGDALALAERIRALVAGQSGQNGITVSIGVTTLDRGSSTAAALREAADAALYAAKGGGRNRVASSGGGNPVA